MIRSATKLSAVSKMATRAALACAAVAVAQPARAETMKARYSLSLIGLPIGQAFATGVIEADNYRIDVSMRTSGLASLVNDTKGAASASGAFSKAGPAPASYSNTTSNSYETRMVKMALNGNSVRAVEVTPAPWDMAMRVPVSDNDRSHIIDPVSALIMSVPASEPLTGPAACNRVIPVFDGVTRFNVSLSFLGVRTVETRGYSGPVSVCGVRYTPIAGHRLDSSSTKFMAENGDMNVWLAPLPNAHAVAPYRIAIRTSVGMLVVEPSEFHLGERHATR